MAVRAPLSLEAIFSRIIPRAALPDAMVIRASRSWASSLSWGVCFSDWLCQPDQRFLPTQGRNRPDEHVMYPGMVTSFISQLFYSLYIRHQLTMTAPRGWVSR